MEIQRKSGKDTGVDIFEFVWFIFQIYIIDRIISILVVEVHVPIYCHFLSYSILIHNKFILHIKQSKYIIINMILLSYSWMELQNSLLNLTISFSNSISGFSTFFWSEFFLKLFSSTLGTASLMPSTLNF